VNAARAVGLLVALGSTAALAQQVPQLALACFGAPTHSPPTFRALTAGIRIELGDGGVATLKEAPFAEFSGALSEGLLDIDGKQVLLRRGEAPGPTVEVLPGRLRVAGKSELRELDETFPPPGESALNSNMRLRELLRPFKRGIVLRPRREALGEHLIAAVREARRAGISSIVIELPPATLSRHVESAIALTLEQHRVELRPCVAPFVQADVLLTIDDRGRLKQALVRNRWNHFTESECILSKASAWEFPSAAPGEDLKFAGDVQIQVESEEDSCGVQRAIAGAIEKHLEDRDQPYAATWFVDPRTNHHWIEGARCSKFGVELRTEISAAEDRKLNAMVFSSVEVETGGVFFDASPVTVVKDPIGNLFGHLASGWVVWRADGGWTVETARGGKPLGATKFRPDAGR
jgi:hypothetical protein